MTLFETGDLLYKNTPKEDSKLYGRFVRVYRITEIHYECFNIDHGVMVLILHHHVHNRYGLTLSGVLNKI